VKSTLSFGEFSKWFNSHNAEQQMNISEAQSLLAKMPSVLNKRYPDLDPGFWTFNENPIQLKAGEELTWGDKKTVKIVSTDNDKITLSNGKEYTPGQFLKFVKEHEVETTSGLPAAQEVKDKITDLINEVDPQADPTGGGDAPAIQGPVSSNTAESYERRSFMSGIWDNLTFLSINDLIRMWQTFLDYWKRSNERISKRRVGAIGKSLPGRLGLEYQNLEQVSENEEVEKIKGELKEQGPDIWRERLISATDTDVLKACTILLCEGGNFDFEDPEVWKVYNRIYRDKQQDDVEYERTKIDPDGRKNKAGVTSLDALKLIMDGFYGKLSGVNWQNQNKSAYNSEMGKFKEDAKSLEATPGGYAENLHEMLTNHKAGEYVTPARYEAFIRYIIENGKAGAEDKIFYIIAGFVTKNPKTGTYLLSRKRLSDINELLNHLPQLDFFTRYEDIIDGTEEEARFKMRKVFDSFNPELDKDNLAKNPKPQTYNVNKVAQYLYKNVNTHKSTITRMAKAARNNREKLDHDDAHIILPGYDYKTILGALGYTRGEDPFITPIGHANGLAGFNEYIKSLGEIASTEDVDAREAKGFVPPAGLLQKVFKTFLMYESYLFERVSSDKKSSLSRDIIHSPTAVDAGKTLHENAQEVKEVLRKVLRAYGAKEDQIKLFLDFKSGKSKPELNAAHEKEMLKFPEFFDLLIQEGGGPERMMNIVSAEAAAGKLSGFSGERKTINRENLDPTAGLSTEGADEDSQGILSDPRSVMGLTNEAVKKNSK
jgi:hypothetical protein